LRRVASIQSGTAGQKGHGLSGTAVVLQGAEHGIDVEEVGGVEAAAALGVADQVMALGPEVADEVGASVDGSIAGDDSGRAMEPAKDATAIDGTVAGERAVADGQGGRRDLQAIDDAAPPGGEVVGDSTVDDVERTLVIDPSPPAAVPTGGEVVGD